MLVNGLGVGLVATRKKLRVLLDAVGELEGLGNVVVPGGLMLLSHGVGRSWLLDTSCRKHKKYERFHHVFCNNEVEDNSGELLAP